MEQLNSYQRSLYCPPGVTRRQFVESNVSQATEAIINFLAFLKGLMTTQMMTPKRREFKEK